MQTAGIVYKNVVFKKNQRICTRLMIYFLLCKLQVSWSVIKAYVRAGGIWAFVLIVIAHTIYGASQVAANIWLSVWSNDAAINGTQNKPLSDLRLGVYGGIGVVQGRIKQPNTYKHTCMNV